MKGKPKSGVISPLFNSACVLAIALSLPQTAFAQDEDEPPRVTERSASGDIVTVTATRVARDGYSAPTPVTVFNEEDLARSGEINAFSAVNQLPSLANSNSTQTFGTVQSTGTGGLSTLNLRGLGTNRTLTLVDGQRVVGALNIGVTDASAFPQDLVKRVEIVTGGASASWGSDAVAGVVNYVLDHDFTGIKGHIRGGVSTYGDDEQGAISLTAGTKFANDRGHFIVSGSYHESAGVPRGIGGRDWYDATRILQRTIANTPAGEPQYIVAPNVVDMRLAPGGVITSGPLMGIAFGPGGSPYNFQYGPLIAPPNMAGGDQSGDIGNNSNLESSLRRETLYARVSYDLTESINIYATYNHGGVFTSAHSYPGQFRTGTLTIQCDNAFLPAEIAASCAANSITEFRFGSYIADLPDTIAENTRNMNRFTAGADGAFTALDTEWNWSAYYTHGRTYTNSTIVNGGLNNKLAYAIDAVRAPDGAIVCRSALAQANGCVPFNIMGTGVASQSAIDFVLGEPYLDTWLTQDAASVSMTGEPFSNWAGPVSVVVGADYRREAFRQRADAASTGDAGDPLLNAGGRNWFTGNFQPASGSFDVWEGFAETVVPLVDTDALGTAELSLAVRATEYSTAGYVTTWKIGATWDTPIQGVRLRGLQSRDIRAPNLSELFRAPGNFTGTVIDRFPPYAGQEFTANLASLANLELRPEKSTTRQVGIIIQPGWLDGFNASVDYYNIEVEDAIGSVGAQTQIDLCFQGNATLCDFIIRDGSGAIVEVQQKPINLSSTVTSGMDIEFSYQSPADRFFSGLDGDLIVRALATHVFKYDTKSGIPNDPVNHIAGQNSGSIANWRLYGTQTYSADRFRVTLTERYVSPGVINNNWIECTADCPAPTLTNPTVNNNRIKGAFYLDLGGSYSLTSKDRRFQSEIYFKVNNLLNLDPPLAPSAGSNPYLVRSTNASLYDNLGRFFRFGLRFTY